MFVATVDLFVEMNHFDERPYFQVLRPAQCVGWILDVIVPLGLLLVGIFGSRLGLSVPTSYALIGVGACGSFVTLVTVTLLVKERSLTKWYLFPLPPAPLLTTTDGSPVTGGELP